MSFVGPRALLPAEIETYGLAKQMRDAALSVTSDIAEGYGRYHYQENIQFCRQARGSLYELIDQFTACFDQEFVDGSELESLKREAYAVVKSLNGYISATKKRQEQAALKLQPAK